MSTIHTKQMEDETSKVFESVDKFSGDISHRLIPYPTKFRFGLGNFEIGVHKIGLMLNLKYSIFIPLLSANSVLEAAKEDVRLLNWAIHERRLKPPHP